MLFRDFSDGIFLHACSGNSRGHPFIKDSKEDEVRRHAFTCAQYRDCRYETKLGKTTIFYDGSQKAIYSTDHVDQLKFTQGVDTTKEVEYLENGYFIFRDQLYHDNCIPSFAGLERSIVPAYESCKRYYELKRVKEGIFVPVLHECPHNYVFDAIIDQCKYVENTPADCYRDAQICKCKCSDPNLDVSSKTSHEISKRSPQTLESLRNSFQVGGTHGFLYKGHYYDQECIPLIYEIISKLKLPFPGDCHLYYSYQPPRPTPVLIRCSNHRYFDHEAERCVSGVEPEDCVQDFGCSELVPFI